jgi:hypothetical protein
VRFDFEESSFIKNKNCLAFRFRSSANLLNTGYLFCCRMEYAERRTDSLQSIGKSRGSADLRIAEKNTQCTNRLQAQSDECVL